MYSSLRMNTLCKKLYQGTAMVRNLETEDFAIININLPSKEHLIGLQTILKPFVRERQTTDSKFTSSISIHIKVAKEDVSRIIEALNSKNCAEYAEETEKYSEQQTYSFYCN